ncbi:hypothetical protein Tco_1473326 [Tanacetum coccineum]
MATASPSPLHIVLFPFMAKGHTIPIMQLARMLLSRNAMITLLTTPDNHPYILTSLSDTPTTIISIPFLKISGVPFGVESIDKLPSMLLYLPFITSTKLMKFDFEQAVQSLKKPVTFMVTEGFFGWTVKSAKKLKISRLVYYGMSNFAITMSEFDDTFTGMNPNSPYVERIREMDQASSKSYGLLTNTFFELEPMFTEYWNSRFGPKSWYKYNRNKVFQSTSKAEVVLGACEKSATVLLTSIKSQMYTFSPMMVANSRKHHCRVRVRPYTREVLVISTNLDIQKNHYPLDFRNRRGDEARIKNTWYNQGLVNECHRRTLKILLRL